MNEENKITGMPGDTTGNSAEAAENTPVNGEETEALNNELESLRETFQEKYDETVEEANSMPVIQELEDGEEAEEPEEEQEETAAAEQEKAPKKKRKPGKIIAITIPVLLLLLVVGSLGAYVVASMTNPNFSSFISAYAQATAAEDYETKLEYLEKALEYCGDKESTFQQAMAGTIQEEMAVIIYEEEGFGAAYSYMTSEMSEAQINNPASAEFKEIVKAIDALNSLSLTVFSKVYENLGDAKELPAEDVLMNGIDFPEDMQETAASVVTYIAKGYIANKEAKGIEDSLRAMNYYANAYSALLTIGADERELAEQIVVDLYAKGYIIEAMSFAAIALDPAAEDVNKDYIALKEEIAAYKELGISVIAIAEDAVAAKKTTEKSVLSRVKKKAAMTDVQADIITKLVMYAIEGIEAENAKNLTRATTVYATFTSVLEAFGMDDVAAHIRTATVIFESGNLNDASTLVTTYLTEEAMKDATKEQKAQRNRMDSVLNALSATSEVFSPYYSAYYQQGTAIDVDALTTELNKLITDKTDNYMEGFVNYCLYIATISTGDYEKASAYLDKMSELMPDLPFIYGYSYIGDYLAEGKIEEAYNYALTLLDVNIADEYANSVVALYERVNGDLKKAEETALKGIELSGSASADCAQQLAIIYMLKGDFESAFSYISAVFNESQTMDSYEYVLIFNALYKGDNADLKASLAELVSMVEETYSYYGVTSYAETTALIEGTMTLEDVFMSGDYTLTVE